MGALQLRFIDGVVASVPAMPARLVGALMAGAGEGEGEAGLGLLLLGFWLELFGVAGGVTAMASVFCFVPAGTVETKSAGGVSLVTVSV